jgi:hypothetical protein
MFLLNRKKSCDGVGSPLQLSIQAFRYRAGDFILPVGRSKRDEAIYGTSTVDGK